MEALDSASDSAPVPALLQRILAARQLLDLDAIQRFCEPRLSHLHDPGLMPGVDVAAARIVEAVRRDELIAIYGDYDVDGVCATAILYHTIKTVQPAARIRTYVPHRLDEGYGLNADALSQLRAEGVSLVVSVDCGISAIAAAQVAAQIGLDLIITDHHDLHVSMERSSDGGQPAASRNMNDDMVSRESAPVLPDALALVHPRLPGSQYPFGELCGAGVAFKLAWRFGTAWCNSQRVSAQLQQTLVSMLPLAALATIADVVPLIGENRVLAAFGLRIIKQTPLPGLRALIEAAGVMDEKIDCEKVGFLLAPRLNACGRMGHAAEAVELLTTAGPEGAASIARRLTQLNQHRQSVERTIFDAAARLAEDNGMTRSDRRAIVLAHESWHPGVVGIVCSRLVDRFTRPAVLVQRGQDTCKGSARSIEGYSIHEALSAASAWLTTYGGHAMAAGLTLPPANFDAFADALLAHANQHIDRQQLTPAITIDCDAAMDDLSIECVQRLHALAPFGRGNDPPLLRLADAVVVEPPRQMGSQGRHLQLKLRQASASNGARRVMRGVWWNAGDRAADLAAGMRLDLAIEPKLNQYNGLTSVEVHVQDVMVRESRR